jgi:hypothetical protein
MELLSTEELLADIERHGLSPEEPWPGAPPTKRGYDLIMMEWSKYV